MAHLIPHDPQKAQELDKMMSETLFRDVDSFIQLYNSGIITRKHKDNKKFADLIVDTYKNIEERRNQLGFISEEEIIIKESSALLTTWAVLTRLKRQFKEAVDANVISETETLVIDSDGNVLRPGVDEETGEKILNSIEETDKVFTRSATSFETVVEQFGDHGATDTTVNVPVAEALALDTDFIKQFKDILPSE